MRCKEIKILPQQACFFKDHHTIGRCHFGVRLQIAGKFEAINDEFRL